jgi:GNAT superfamily N-acetyltransferase
MGAIIHAPCDSEARGASPEADANGGTIAAHLSAEGLAGRVRPLLRVRNLLTECCGGHDQERGGGIAAPFAVLCTLGGHRAECTPFVLRQRHGSWWSEARRRPEPVAPLAAAIVPTGRRPWANVPGRLTLADHHRFSGLVTLSLAGQHPINDVVIEEVAARAWSALERVPLDMWLLRASQGFTRSANSVAVLGAQDGAGGSREALDERIDRVEDFYRERGLPARFQLTFGERHRRLGNHLIERGYEQDGGDGKVVDAALRTLRSAAPAERDGRVLIADAPSQEWIDLWWSTRTLDDSLREPATELLWDLRGRCGFAGHVTEGQLVAVGLGIIDGPWVGIHCVGVRADRRRRGSGRRIVGALATWGIAHAAQTAYAALDDADTAAGRLFDALAFSAAYRYHFLRRDLS